MEAGVDVKIRRGRLPREILKQERLAPLSPEQQLAWLVAYHDERAFDALAGAAVQELLARLLHQAAAGAPRLAAGWDAWREAIAGWLREAGDEPLV
ncbi:MAG: hypothetical protein V5B39_03235 [Accumulibacter sp.]|uniref:hypothetical protein n=1 Tax=Accumulibacter sp. TaxID=2053492 RepID=UPI002FC2959F